MYFTIKLKHYLAVTLLLSALTASFCAMAIINVRMQTDLGPVDIELFDTQAPMNVNNFLNYVNDGDYIDTFFHRLIPGFVLQGGSYIFNPENGSLVISEGDRSGNGGSQIPADNIVVENEADPINRPNLRGTISMALVGNQPDSAGNGWFVNLVNNPFLDDPANPANPNDPGPFTVIGQINEDGMAIIDAIVSETENTLCKDLLFFTTLCGPGSPSTLYQDLPLVGMSGFPDASVGPPTTLIDDVSSVSKINQYNLVNILHIGSDTDGDGVADSAEDEGPNSGDADNDSTPDRDQPDIASYRAISGNLITLETTAGVVLESTSYMGRTFGFTTYDVLNPPAVIDGFNFVHGHLGFKLTNITDPLGKATVSVTSEGCRTTNSYFQYGPTPNDPTMHWYEFNYDMATDTGAKINGNVITLHYVDGERGDSALGVAGVIETLGGSASDIVMAPDNDGLPPFVEDGAPNGGDGNNDGICDSEQGNVVSFPSGPSNEYMTIVGPSAVSVNYFGAIDVLTLLSGQDISGLTGGVNLAFDFLFFEVDGLANNGDSVEVRWILPEQYSPVSFFMFGPTPDNPLDHLYEFLFDPVTGTGAEFDGNEVILHFVDGERGDFDLLANGVILDPGTPALFAATIAPDNGGGGGGGCSLGDGTDRPAQAGAWYLLLLLSVLYGIFRYYRQIRPTTGKLL